MKTNDNKEFTLPFGIDFVVKEDLSKLPGFQVHPAPNSSYDITCPFCGGKRKMNINILKNVAKCNKCGCGNGYNTITLHSALTGLDNKESFKDLLNRWKGLESEVKVQYQNHTKEDFTGITPAPIEIRDKVYRRLLSKLSLSEKHKEDLLKRGLCEDSIISGLYKTVPAVGFHSLAYDAVFNSGAIKDLSTHKTWGIPGFTDVQDAEKVSLRGRKHGYFIPVLSREGLISGMQIRYDNLAEDASDKEKEEYKKYSWYSSSEKKTGCSITGCENIHFAGCFNDDITEINLTEGVLKADIASALSGEPFLGLVGVNNIRQLKPTLEKLIGTGTSVINLYIDMDYADKKEVASALLGIKKEINRAGSHKYEVLEKTHSGLRICSYEYPHHHQNPEDFRKSVKIYLDEPFPKDTLIFLGKMQVPQEMYAVKENEIEFDFNYISSLKNTAHTLRIINTCDSFKNYPNLSTIDRQRLLSENLFCSIKFNKTGLTYKEMNWNKNYKGIDDYFLYLKSVQNAE